MRNTSSAHAKEQLSLIDLAPAPAATRGDARRRGDGSRRALQAATNARRCEELLAALDRVADSPSLAAVATRPRPAASKPARVQQGPFAAAPELGKEAAREEAVSEEVTAQHLAELYAACERASDEAVAIPRRAAR